MKREKAFKIGLLISLIPLIIGLYFYGQVPDLMPTHFDFNNEPDRYSSKEFALFGLPLIMIGVYILVYFLTKVDPRRKYQSEKVMNITLLIIPIVSILTTLFTIFYTLGHRPNLGMWLNIFISILFIFIGNYMPKIRRNYTMGIKLPWTLHSDYVWDKTHRLGGMVFVIGGVINLIMSFISLRFIFVTYLLIVVIPIVYSYLVYRGLGNEE